MEGNRLIAEFLNLEVSEERFPGEGDLYYVPDQHLKGCGDWLQTWEMKYYSSWDWLMTVVEAINDFKDENGSFLYQVIIKPTRVKIHIRNYSAVTYSHKNTVIKKNSKKIVTTCRHGRRCMREMVYMAVLKLIRVHNKLNKVETLKEKQ